MSNKWQQGYELEYLRSLAKKFHAHDNGRCLSGFSKVKENNIAWWLNKRDVRETETGVVVFRRAQANTAIKDFRGVEVGRIRPGTLVIERACGKAEDIVKAVKQYCYLNNLNVRADKEYGPWGPEFPSSSKIEGILWRTWVDHPEELQAAAELSLQRIGTAITASSEIRAIRTLGMPVTNLMSEVENLGISECRTGIEAPAALEQWPSLVSEIWQDHYSTYNKGKTWHAVALRGFGGDPAFIEKPSEMPKKWKTEHHKMLKLECSDTPLFDALPDARLFIDQLQCRVQRVRLMRLTGEGGELKRHADIVDKEAGLADGKIARLHYPITTHAEVEFTSWNLNNEPIKTHMRKGRWWYLDVRKPHAAINPANVERVHLVVDAVSNEWLRSFISNHQE